MSNVKLPGAPFGEATLSRVRAALASAANSTASSGVNSGRSKKPFNSSSVLLAKTLDDAFGPFSDRVHPLATASRASHGFVSGPGPAARHGQTSTAASAVHACSTAPARLECMVDDVARGPRDERVGEPVDPVRRADSHDLTTVASDGRQVSIMALPYPTRQGIVVDPTVPARGDDSRSPYHRARLSMRGTRHGNSTTA